MPDPFLALGGLATVGLSVSAYFLLVGYGWVRPDTRLVPRVCRMDRTACLRILHTRWGRLLGIPNALPGVAWYAGLLGAAAAAAKVDRLPGCEWLLAASVAVLGLSVVLAWSLLARLKVACTLCFTVHAVNLAVVVTLAVAC